MCLLVINDGKYLLLVLCLTLLLLEEYTWVQLLVKRKKIIIITLWKNQINIYFFCFLSHNNLRISIHICLQLYIGWLLLIFYVVNIKLYDVPRFTIYILQFVFLLKTLYFPRILCHCFYPKKKVKHKFSIFLTKNTSKKSFKRALWNQQSQVYVSMCVKYLMGHNKKKKNWPLMD